MFEWVMSVSRVNSETSTERLHTWCGFLYYLSKQGTDWQVERDICLHFPETGFISHCTTATTPKDNRLTQSDSQPASHWYTIKTDRGHNWIILWYEYFGDGGATMYPHLWTGNNDKNLHNSLVNFKTKEMRNGHHNGAAVSILWGLSLYRHNVCMCMSWRAAEHRRLGGRTAGRKGKSERSRVFSWRSYILLLKYFPSVHLPLSVCLSGMENYLLLFLHQQFVRTRSSRGEY